MRTEHLSHQPLRTIPERKPSPLPDGPLRFVNAHEGNDLNDGSEFMPWRTINHAMTKLVPGDTLCLREGIYHENVYCSAYGRSDAPITIRAYPGEVPILDGGISEFLESPATSWTPYTEGAPEEYRSTRRYPNIRDVVGLFGDSHIGLQTYWHIEDLRTDNEKWIRDPAKESMVLPVYCGPGLYYDQESGYIHIRLAHTHIDDPRVDDYAGETDPRKLPLVIAPFRSNALFVDLARYVRFEDLVMRGGGHDTVVLQFGIDLVFDNVTIYGGSYCLRSRNTGPCKITNSALHGMIPPWAFRDENSLYTYTPTAYDPFLTGDETKNLRNIARMPTHAVLVMEGFEEGEIFAYPFNHDWEISHSEFTDGHDGLHINGRRIHFHQVDSMPKRNTG